MIEAQPLNLRLEPSELGEGAFFSKDTLYWVDISQGAIHAYVLKSGDHRQWSMPGPVSFVVPDGETCFLVGRRNGVYRFDTKDGSTVPLAVLDLPDDHRLNDGKIGPDGRLWVGTICTAAEPSPTAALYRLDGNQLSEVEGGYANANGKAWSPDGRKMYHADTSRNTIWQYDYNCADGSIANRQAFAKVEDGSPDGLTSDSEGRVYAALYGGSGVGVFSHQGKFIEKIVLPVPNVTSCVFGGEGLRTLFITTAFDGMDVDTRKIFPLSGQVFHARLTAPGPRYVPLR
jgi:sugar lactone lactonase YvrE